MSDEETIRLMKLEDVVDEKTTEMRVSNSTDIRSLSTGILRTLDEGKRVVLSCIGAQAVSQAMKGVAVANGEAVVQGKLLAVVPTFHVKKFPDRTDGREVEMTAIRFIIGRVPVMI